MVRIYFILTNILKYIIYIFTCWYLVFSSWSSVALGISENTVLFCISNKHIVGVSVKVMYILLLGLTSIFLSASFDNK